MANIGKLNVTLVANSGPFSKGMRSAQKSASKFIGNMRSFGPSVSGAMTSMFRRASQFSALLAGGLVYGVAKAAGAIDNLAKSSRKLLGNDGATGTLAGLRLAGNLAGVEVATLDKSMEKMLETVSKAGEKDAMAIEALDRIGVSSRDLVKASPEKRLEMIAAGIDKIGDAGDKIAAARGIFGKGGGALIELFRGGAESIAKARREAELFGLSLSGNAAAAVEKMNDNFTRLGSVVQGTFMQITAQVAPVISAMTDKFLEQIEAVGGVGNAVDTAFNFIVEKSVPVLNEIGEIYEAFKRMGGAANGVDIGDGGLFGQVTSALTSINNAIDKATLNFLKLKKLFNESKGAVDGALAVITGSEGRAKKTETERMVGGINPKHQEEFRKRLEAAGGPEVGMNTFGNKSKAAFEIADETDQQIKAMEKGMAERAKMEKEVDAGTRQPQGLGDRFKAFVFDAQKAADTRLDGEKKITDEIEKQTASIEGRAGQGEQGLIAFGFNGDQSTKATPTVAAQSAMTSTGKDGPGGDKTGAQQVDYLRQIATNTRNPAAVLA